MRTMANSGDPAEIPQNAIFHQGLHCKNNPAPGKEILNTVVLNFTRWLCQSPNCLEMLSAVVTIAANG